MTRRAGVRELILLAGLVALSACLAPQGPSGPGSLGEFTVVALGDSFGSGQGAPDERFKWWKWATTPRWEDKRCNRSEFAGASQAVARLKADHPDKGIELVSVACSGASIPEGLLGPHDGAEPPAGPHLPLPPQVESLEVLASISNGEIGAVVISVGGNDVYFEKLVAVCGLPKPISCKLTKPIVDAALQVLEQRFDDLAQALAASPDPIPSERVFLTEYPDPTRDSDGSYCAEEPSDDPLLKNITLADAKFASEYVVPRINYTICKAAERHGWAYVDGIVERFDGHGWCAGDNWINTVNESLCRQRHYRGGLHPNRQGYEAIAEPIADAIEPLLNGQMPGPPTCDPP